MAARRAHNPKVGGSSPPFATTFIKGFRIISETFFYIFSSFLSSKSYNTLVVLIVCADTISNRSKISASKYKNIQKMNPLAHIVTISNHSYSYFQFNNDELETIEKIDNITSYYLFVLKTFCPSYDLTNLFLRRSLWTRKKFLLQL